MEEHFVLAAMLQLWFMILLEVKYHLLGWCMAFIFMVRYVLCEENASFVLHFFLLLDSYYLSPLFSYLLTISAISHQEDAVFMQACVSFICMTYMIHDVLAMLMVICCPFV